MIKFIKDILIGAVSNAAVIALISWYMITPFVLGSDGEPTWLLITYLASFFIALGIVYALTKPKTT